MTSPLTATATLQTQETDTGLILIAPHSELEFPIWQAGFRLRRGGELILQSASGWGSPSSNLNLWSVQQDHAVLTYNRGTHGLGRLTVVALEHGWRFTWDQPTRDVISLASGKHWYGQGELINQLFPLEAASVWEAPLMTWDNGPTGLGNIQEAAWITASGVALIVEEAAGTLQVGLNAPPAAIQPPQWDLNASQSSASVRPHPAMAGASGTLTLSDRRNPLSYMLLVAEDMVKVHQRFTRIIGKPETIPPEDFLREPIWTTWARYKTKISQDVVLQFAHEIRKNGYPGGTMEIDDKWQQFYGDSVFDETRFPDPQKMIAELNANRFNVTMWVHPFLEGGSRNTSEALRQNFLVRRMDGRPYDVPWWQGRAFLLDVSNPYALEWWGEKLKTLQTTYGLAGFKFDAGEGNYLPADAQCFQPIQRNDYSSKWVQFAAVNFPYCEVRSGWHSQRYPILFRQWDKFSTWGLDNGLASIITTALALGMAGYPFVLPDMIGGNAYNEVTADKELVIRWTQASAPMLAIQFSLAPWDYDQETVDICRRYAQLHVDLTEDRLRAARQAVEKGAPVVRPILWVDPHDMTAQTVGDQFMLGDTLMAAPVVMKGAVKRDVYLPAGNWRDYWSETRYTGGQWLRDYPAPLDVLPLFVRE
ncbi:MAG: glycoside hydrolase [Anaerolineae bacterium]|nr:glycoside hydrolase [Anaerolineae bacterium]